MNARKQYVEVSLVPAHSGFGEWSRHGSPSEPWDDIDDLLAESEPRRVVRLGSLEAIDAGVQDIRGLIQEEPTHVYAVQDDAGDWHYFGINEITV